jgi:hypothetical protein
MDPFTKTATIDIEDAPKDVGIIVAWKKGAVSSLLGKVFNKKTDEKSLGIGTDHAMNLLGELHKK